jgi:hypothetical protein
MCLVFILGLAAPARALNVLAAVNMDVQAKRYSRDYPINHSDTSGMDDGDSQGQFVIVDISQKLPSDDSGGEDSNPGGQGINGLNYFFPHSISTVTHHPTNYPAYLPYQMVGDFLHLFPHPVAQGAAYGFDIASFAAGGPNPLINGLPMGTPGGSRTRFTAADSADATGEHSLFRRGPDGTVTHYETRQPQTNPNNPNPWEFVNRFDGQGPAHNGVDTPHIHEADGSVRPANPDELPSGY